MQLQNIFSYQVSVVRKKMTAEWLLLYDDFSIDSLMKNMQPVILQ